MKLIYLLTVLSLGICLAEEEKAWRKVTHEEFLTTDKKLQKTYTDAQNSLLKQWGVELGKERIKHLNLAQQAWLKWRPLEAEVRAYEESKGGHTHGECISYIQVALTKQRIKDLSGKIEAQIGKSNKKVVISKPKRGSKDRKAICDAFRKPMNEVVNGQKIVFVISSLKTFEGYAFIQCSIQLASGKEVVWSKTKYKEDFNDGNLENNAVGLLRKNSQGNWVVLESSFSQTDAWYIGWAEFYQIPVELFSH